MELVRNSVLSLILNVTSRAANALIFVLIGRRMGAAQAGIFQLSTTYLLFFTVFTRGFDELVMRHVARSPQDAKRYFHTFVRLRLVLTVVLYGALVATVVILLRYPTTTVAPILIVSLCLVPDGLISAANAIMLGQRRFGKPALVAVGMCALRLALGGLLVYRAASLVHIAVLWCFSSAVGAVISVVFVTLHVRALPGKHTFDGALVKQELPAVVPFVINGFLMAVEFQIDTLLLSVLKGERDVGWYGAATTIVFTLGMIPQAYRMAVYPLMSFYSVQNRQRLIRLYEISLRYLGTLALPIVAGLVVLASSIVDLVFGSDFLPTVWVLRYLVIVLLFLFLNVPNVRMMFVHNRQGWVTWMLAGSMLINVALNLWIIPTAGVQGAALARVCSSLAFFLLDYLVLQTAVAKLKTSLVRLLWRPTVATVLMSALIWAIRDLHLLVVIPVGAVVYFGSLLLIGGIPREDLHLLYASFQNRHQPRTNP